MEARRNSHKQQQGDQLRLIQGDALSGERERRWRLDPETKAQGLVGVAQARQALAEVQPPEHPLRRAS